LEELLVMQVWREEGEGGGTHDGDVEADFSWGMAFDGMEV
jgi:hypothetical protein